MAQITSALARARRRGIDIKARTIKHALQAEQLSQPAPVVAAYAAAVRAHAALLLTMNEQITAMETQVDALFMQHPDAAIYLSQCVFEKG
jgi:hypothetical protein